MWTAAWTQGCSRSIKISTQLPLRLCGYRPAADPATQRDGSVFWAPRTVKARLP